MGGGGDGGGGGGVTVARCGPMLPIGILHLRESRGQSTYVSVLKAQWRRTLALSLSLSLLAIPWYVSTVGRYLMRIRILGVLRDFNNSTCARTNRCVKLHDEDSLARTFMIKARGVEAFLSRYSEARCVMTIYDVLLCERYAANVHVYRVG